MKSNSRDYLLLVAEACRQKFCVDGESHEGCKQYLLMLSEESLRPTEEKFDEAIQSKDVSKFVELLRPLRTEHLIDINNGEWLGAIAPEDIGINNGIFDPGTTQKKLREFADEHRLQGIFSVSDRQRTYELAPEEARNRPFAIHSIGKVFTGVLIAKMIADGDIAHEQMTQPLELSEEVLSFLPEKLREHLPKTTLHQAMTHAAGFTDYLCHSSGYMDRLKSGEELTATRPEDFLQFAQSTVCDFEPGKGSNYSNTGILLAGLAAQHLYNRNKPESERKTYQELLEEKILRPAEIENFSVTKPENALFNEEHIVAGKINGSPAGGYWATASDMQKFGRWLCENWKNEGFRNAVQEFGQEFFDAKSQTIQHSGGIPGPAKGAPGSTSWFSANMENGIVVVAGSRDGGATFGLNATLAVNKAVERDYEQQKSNSPERR